MSRSGYDYDCDGWALICWSGAVKSAFRGRRGQAFLREMLSALDAMPIKRLIHADLERDGEVCAMGAVAAARGMDLAEINPEDRDAVANALGIAEAMAAEIAYCNDEMRYSESSEECWTRMRAWVASKIAPRSEE